MPMYEHLKPFGFINDSCIVGVSKSERGNYYIIDDAYNYLLCSESTYLNLLANGKPFIESKRKGV